MNMEARKKRRNQKGVAHMVKRTVEQLLTVGGVARIIQKSPDTVRNYERNGKLRAIKTESNIRLFQRHDVMEFVRRHSLDAAKGRAGQVKPDNQSEKGREG